MFDLKQRVSMFGERSNVLSYDNHLHVPLERFPQRSNIISTNNLFCEAAVHLDSYYCLSHGTFSLTYLFSFSVALEINYPKLPLYLE